MSLCIRVLSRVWRRFAAMQAFRLKRTEARLESCRLALEAGARAAQSGEDSEAAIAYAVNSGQVLSLLMLRAAQESRAAAAAAAAATAAADAPADRKDAKDAKDGKASDLAPGDSKQAAASTAGDSKSAASLASSMSLGGGDSSTAAGSSELERAVSFGDATIPKPVIAPSLIEFFHTLASSRYPSDPLRSSVLGCGSILLFACQAGGDSCPRRGSDDADELRSPV